MTRALLSLIVANAMSTNCIAADDAIILATNPILAGTADSSMFGQSFTVSDPIAVSCVEIYVQRKSGGSSFQFFIKPFDPWTNVAGTALAAVTVPLEDLPTEVGGGWMTVQFPAPVSITIPGVYGVFADTDSSGFPDGYNGYGYSEGDSIEGGRLVGPTFNRDVEMMVRLRGAATEGALRPPDLLVPQFTSITSESRYTAFGTFTFVRFEWDTESGVVYRVLRSDDLVVWRDNDLLRLGDGLETYYETSNQYRSKRFIKVEAQPLGDYKP